ncbi:MAG: BamA/TamA family outer membrane protein [Chthonomonas sp.]|nr:BamA/TamA family outer membrane protein [Chthonomonas sp.]
MPKGVGTLLLFALAATMHAQSTMVIKEILVRGNNRITTEAIRANMRAAEGRPFIADELERDQNTLRAQGVFKDVKVFSRQLSDSEVQIIVDIEENPVVKEISIMGNSVIKTEEILKLVTQQKDALLNFNARRPTAEAIRSLYDQRGYFAEVDFPTMADQPETMVILVIETTINDIIVTGLTRTKSRVVQRMIKSKVGEPLNESTWASDVRRIRSTQWFEKADPGLRPAAEIGKVDLLMDLKETRTAKFDVGVAMDPSSRLAGTFAISDSNFRGMGQNLGARIQQDTFGSGASVSFDFGDPYFDKNDTAIQFSVYSRVQSYFASFGSSSSTLSRDDRFDERRTGGAFNASRPLKGGFYGTLGFSLENIRAINLSSSSAEYIRQDGSLLRGILQLSRDRRDVPLDPFEGDYFRASVEPGISKIDTIGGSVASFTDVLGKNPFVRTTMEYKAFYSRRPADRRKLTDPRPVLAFRSRMGMISGDVPFYEQMFIGGSDSLRGYAEQRFWGKNAIVASAEYRYPMPMSDAFTVIGFVDYGGAWGGYPGISNFSQSDSMKLHLGYGAGVGFRTPLGSIRIDFGFRPDGGSRTHFSIGGSF